MKKKMMMLAMVVILAVTVFAGCGTKKGASEVTGTFMDKKDFMFTVQDSEGTFYGFNFDEKPENYEEFNNGDQVKVTYTGTISEVDPFQGEIISIEKAE